MVNFPLVSHTNPLNKAKKVMALKYWLEVSPPKQIIVVIKFDIDMIRDIKDYKCWGGVGTSTCRI